MFGSSFSTGGFLVSVGSAASSRSIKPESRSRQKLLFWNAEVTVLVNETSSKRSL